MGVSAAGSVVLVPFPFSDLSRSKLRPAVVLAAVGHDDFILCQITSNPYSDDTAMELVSAAFASGSLQRTSYARPGKLFTANVGLIVRDVGILRDQMRDRIIEAVVATIRGTRRA